MSRADKRLAQMRANPQGWRYDQVATILKRHGFTTDTSGGSHRVFTHPSGVVVGLVEKGSGTLLPVYVKNAIAAIDSLEPDA